jgi:hypothetical protein
MTDRVKKIMDSNIKDNLILIQEVANEALELHKNSTERFSGVNYGDLRVVDVYVKYSIHDEDLEYGVLIEECSPTAYELQEYMVEYLKDNLPNNLGWNVYVELEW